MEDIVQPVLVILIGGLFAPVLVQLLEKSYTFITGASPVDKPSDSDATAIKRKKWARFFAIAVITQLILFTCFFFITKWSYFDKNYFKTAETELIREGVKKNKDYIITKITVRIYSESREALALLGSTCTTKPIKHCTLVSISYDIIALKDFKAQKIFKEYYDALYAIEVVKEPGSEEEEDDQNPKADIASYDVKTTMNKFERKTITTRADFLYDSLSTKGRKFFGKEIKSSTNDFFYYPNNEDDVIGQVEFQVISRTLKFNTPAIDDAIFQDEKQVQQSVLPMLTQGDGDCLKFNVISAIIPRLKNNQSFGIKWSW